MVSHIYRDCTEKKQNERLYALVKRPTTSKSHYYTTL